MKKLAKAFISVVFCAVLATPATPVLAAAPVLGVSWAGSGSIQISVSNANPNSSVNLFSRQTSSLWTEVSNIGQTDYNGNFSQTISWPGDGSNNVIQFYVTVGGLQSGTVSVYANGNNCNSGNCGGCTYNCGNLQLSQTVVNLVTGQSATVTASTANNYYGGLYISNNSNSVVATASVSGNSISIYGSGVGSDNITVCQNGNSVCSTIYVSVTAGCYLNNCGGCTYNCNGSLSLSQTSITLGVGQTQSVTVYNSGNSLYISNNSNSSVVSASVSGNQVNIYAYSYGSANIIVCASNTSSCATIYVTVNNSNTSYISLSPSTLNLTSPQTASVTIYNPNNAYGNYYISSNSNPYVASASISGNTLYVNSLVGGSTTIMVCQNGNSGQCSSLYVTVNSGGCNYNNCGGTFSLSQSNLGLSVGQSATVAVNNYNGSPLYVSSNTNPGAVSVSISGSMINVDALNTGSSTINICTNSYGCASLYVTVGVNNGNTFYLSQTSASLSINQSTNIIITGGSNSYYVSGNSNPGVVSASVSGNSLYLTGLGTGYSTVSVCQSGNSYQCATVGVSVNSNNCNFGNCGSTTLSFSQTNVTLSAGQNTYLNIYGNGSYYISSNNNSYVANASISGNQLVIEGLASGSDTITVCQNSGSCGSIYVTVGNCYYSNCNSNGSSISLAPPTLNLTVGQSQNVTISGSGSYYVSSNSNPNVVSVSVSGSTLYVTANQGGSSTVSVCQNSYNACASLFVTVGGGGLQYPGGVLGASTYANGQLIQENGTVYIVYKNTQTGIASADVFTGLGFNFNNVLPVSISLPSSGYTVTTPFASHPWGSWIKYNSTVYFVYEGGLIPIPDWNTFLNNGGQAAWIVPANIYDLRLPVLYPMTYNDSRLQ